MIKNKNLLPIAKQFGELSYLIEPEVSSNTVLHIVRMMVHIVGILENKHPIKDYQHYQLALLDLYYYSLYLEINITRPEGLHMVQIYNTFSALYAEIRTLYERNEQDANVKTPTNSRP